LMSIFGISRRSSRVFSLRSSTLLASHETNGKDCPV
jgi:hypothetical protein